MTITHNGLTLTYREWATKTGIKPHTIETRISRGWDIKKVLETPQVRPPSKNDAMRELNEMAFEQLPKVFQKIVKATKYGEAGGASYKGLYGSFIRERHRAAFDKWFSDEYLPSRMNES
jgi:hypothetical protein